MTLAAVPAPMAGDDGQAAVGVAGVDRGKKKGPFGNGIGGVDRGSEGIDHAAAPQEQTVQCARAASTAFRSL